MKRQRIRTQKREQQQQQQQKTTTEKQMSNLEITNLHEKRLWTNDSKDDSRS